MNILYKTQSIGSLVGIDWVERENAIQAFCFEKLIYRFWTRSIGSYWNLFFKFQSQILNLILQKKLFVNLFEDAFCHFKIL